MSGNPFYLLDVFAENKYSGNQLAVIRVRNPLSDNDMSGTRYPTMICSGSPGR